jgi:hypothetical protein
MRGSQKANVLTLRVGKATGRDSFSVYYKGIGIFEHRPNSYNTIRGSNDDPLAIGGEGRSPGLPS